MTSSRTRRRTAVVLVLAALSLLAAVATAGGASYAGTLAKGVVGTAQLKKGAVTSAKVKDGSLTAADFAAGQLPAGPKGPAGPAGPTGPKGERGPSDAYAASSDGFGTQLTVIVPLPAGTYAVTARADLFSASASSGSCNLGSTGSGGDQAYVAVPAGQEGSGFLQDVFVLAQPGSVTLSCGPGAAQSWGRGSVVAVAVATAHFPPS
ncbi:hypothetical protein G5V58_24020 [Nocardioides anomalus]|uniref:Collagen-like protein n=1 Tax=Nocardioides anomalus TaxID=2712223 RepID=A0A6G6WJS3_9ACTN|nr:hypothetical protein [Nocardioides anomalus]QIG45407.1 hypothetical protein G5V58_24020 [Nocardioides anomalus]